MSAVGTVGPRNGFTLMELLIVISIIALLGALTLGAVGMAKEAARRNQSQYLITQVSTALESHRETRGHYPDSSVRATWITALAPLNGALKIVDGELLDPWDNPIEYRIPRHYDGTYDGTLYHFIGKPIPNPDTYWIWSPGKNQTNDQSDWIESDGRTTRLPMGGGDDQTIWKH